MMSRSSLYFCRTCLHRAGRGVVLLADDVRVDLARGGIQRVHGRVDAQRRDVAREHHGRVQVAEGGGGRRVGQVVRGHVHGLDRRDGAGLRGGDALLQAPHFLGERRLVAHGRRHAAQQRGHFRAGQREAVDVVDEEQDVPALVAEALGHREARERHAQAVARGLVHLAEHHRHLRLREVVLHDDLRVRHLVVEVVALAGALAHAREHGQARVLGRDVVDELQHRHRLAHAGAAEEADLAALGERADEVDHLDARLEELHRGRQLVELGRRWRGSSGARSRSPGRARRSGGRARPSRGRAWRGRRAPRSARRFPSPSSRGAGRRRSPSRWCARSRHRAAAPPRT